MRIIIDVESVDNVAHLAQNITVKSVQKMTCSLTGYPHPSVNL
jgi:hypothetical protein